MNRSSLGFSPLSLLIREEILRFGPVPFPWFMDQALYHPQHGYYRKPRRRIGREGDFYTNVSVGSAFGQILAAQIVEMWSILGKPHDFEIIEQGAEDGQLAADILLAIENSPCEFGKLTYTIVEPAAEKRTEQQGLLQHRFPEIIQWVATLSELQAVQGVFVANELLDALPFYLLEYQKNRWHERYVTCSGRDFAFISLPILSPALSQAVSNLPAPLHSPYRTEVNLGAQHWIREVSTILQTGFVLVIDYGYPQDEYYRAERMEGTLACYSRHCRTFDPLQNPGDLDITSHVNFTALAAAAESAELHLAGYADQHHFMVGATESRLREIERNLSRSDHDQFLRQLNTLMHPGLMGMAFKYLLLTTESQSPAPSGFRYVREPRLALGIF